MPTTYTDHLCTFPPCSKPVRAKRLCGGHYMQQSRGVPLTPLLTTKPSTARCTLSWCPRPYWGNDLCRQHNREKSRSLGAFVPLDAPFKIQQKAGDRWFSVGYATDRKGAHRLLNTFRAGNPATAYRLILGRQYGDA